jgi:hypothetical protein
MYLPLEEEEEEEEEGKKRRRREEFCGTVREPCSTKRIENSGIQHALLEGKKRIITKCKK